MIADTREVAEFVEFKVLLDTSRDKSIHATVGYTTVVLGPIITKFGMIDYVGDPYPYANFR